MALVQARLEQVGGASSHDDVTMVRTRSQTAGTPRDSPPTSPRRNSPGPRPANPRSNDGMDNDVDRSFAVNIVGESGVVKTFLPPTDFDNLDTTGRDSVALRTLALAPWWEKDSVCAEDHMGFAAYADARGYLPGLIHVDGLRTWMWQRAFCVRDRDLRVDADQFVRTVREDFVAACCDGLSRLREIEPLDDGQGVDLFVARNRTEYDYVEALAGVTQRLLNSWNGISGVRQNAIILPRSLLRKEFRYDSKSSDFWTVYTAEERWCRHVYGRSSRTFAPKLISSPGQRGIGCTPR